MSLPATTQDNIKDVMRTALVGIKPADQVILKGYLRVLLRLEADLEWVSANHPEVDLFMINDEFRQSDNIIRLIQSNSQKPVLYVGHTVIKGELVENLITLPLKETDKLNDWLFANVSVLNVHISKRRNTAEKIINSMIEDRRITEKKYQDFEELVEKNVQKDKSVVNQFDPKKQSILEKYGNKNHSNEEIEISLLVDIVKLLKRAEEVVISFYQAISL